MSITIRHRSNHKLWSNRKCTICGSQAVGVNFGALTCAPCKAFFRRNARRREVLQIPCVHRMRSPSSHSNDLREEFVEIRHCSSCRLRRCLAMGMKEELIRTDEENARYKQLIDANRQRKELSEQTEFCSILLVKTNLPLMNESNWRHLSNIVSTYDTYCLNTYIQRRAMLAKSFQCTPMEHVLVFSMNLTASLYSFFRSLSVFHSLSQVNQIHLCKSHFPGLFLPNFFELKQVCFFEPWQISSDKAILEWICGSQLYQQFLHTEKVAEKLIITDPVVTRVWLIVLFFSPSFSCIHPSNRSFQTARTKSTFTSIRDTYLALLWNYLSYRYGDDGTVRIYSNLIFAFMKMQSIAFDIGVQIQIRSELMNIYQSVDQFLTRSIRHGQ